MERLFLSAIVIKQLCWVGGFLRTIRARISTYTSTNETTYAILEVSFLPWQFEVLCIRMSKVPNNEVEENYEVEPDMIEVQSEYVAELEEQVKKTSRRSVILNGNYHVSKICMLCFVTTKIRIYIEIIIALRIMTVNINIIVGSP